MVCFLTLIRPAWEAWDDGRGLALSANCQFSAKCNMIYHPCCHAARYVVSGEIRHAWSPKLCESCFLTMYWLLRVHELENDCKYGYHSRKSWTAHHYMMSQLAQPWQAVIPLYQGQHDASATQCPQFKADKNFCHLTFKVQRSLCSQSPLQSFGSCSL